MAGPTTAGYAAQAAGEPWHYVGGVGEPDFATGWDTLGAGEVGFRIREAGIIDIQGLVNFPTGSPTNPIFTLPEGYRPSENVYVGQTCNTDTSRNGTDAACLLLVKPDGDVEVSRVVSNTETVPPYVALNAQVFLTPSPFF